jgi:glycosyltransferase involved in cell wall biosynthesis
MPLPLLTVALVSTQRRWHGGEEQARLLAVGLRRRGHRCVVFARRSGAFARRMAEEGFDVVAFAGGGRNPAALWQMRHALRRLQPDVLHYNDAHAVVGAGLAAFGLPIAARIAARRVDFAVRSPRPYRWFCDRILCVSHAVEKACLAGRLPAGMLRVVHDGVDPDRVRSGNRQRGRHSLELAEDQTLLLTVATLTDHKGHRFLLEALPSVLAKNPRTLVALAGDGALRESLERQAERLGIASHVRFLGFRRDVPDLIQAADVFVLPSQLEGLCSTLIDVMLAGRTIVATTAGGIPDLLGNNTDEKPVAWLVPPRDPKSLAEAIHHALTSPVECAEMRERAGQRALQHFTADCMVEATLAVYRERKGIGDGGRGKRVDSE